MHGYPNYDVVAARDTAHCDAGGSSDIPRELESRLLAGRAAILVRSNAHASGIHGIAFAVAGLAMPSLANFMATHCRGIVSATLDAESALRLGLSLGARPIDRGIGRGFLVSVEAACCDGTGISAADRALTLRTIGAPGVSAPDLVTPGHIMPMLVRPVAGNDAPLPDIAHMIVERLQDGRRFRSAAWCDILDEEGCAASSGHCLALAERNGLPVIRWTSSGLVFPLGPTSGTVRSAASGEHAA
ncbi:3,4-dihydroxy-2-butanone-4-phosphate synthase [Neoroseomonas soli]|uniref:3,4-dihydroxy-2-butanone 4-phosphate synthase n=1 Tax=Neoroseomonas soli TaxID=1081025 RepID=A0A9X9WX32_9PROT|nr:3,4-dihydroxy-2-butanone-4-phosphate synthase [Neoroseomonas soli]MBR0671711.1 3,4-dihydroxy-2-butanone-4-phosphate synthase [Neoroseomonas soli]